MIKLIPGFTLLLIATSASAQSLTDPNLKIQRWVKGLSQPTGIAFVDNAGTALALEKASGRVRVIRGKTISGTALDLPVANDSERGLLGIALSPTFASDRFVYLYYTSAASDGAAAIDNRIERYVWDGSKLAFNRRVMTLPATPGPNHNGGRIAFGPDQKLYAVIGELNRNERTSNFESSSSLNRIGSILRVNPSGSSVATNPFYSAANVGTANAPLNDIYAYGVRNSFGLAFDPVSGDLWDSENGPDKFDEINRVRPGFNSGWEDVMGPSSRNRGTGTLVSLGPRAYYSDPRFSWSTPVAPTDLEFFPSARLGAQYKNDLFVGTLHGGAILHFDVSASRKTLALSGALADGVADNSSANLFGEQSDVLFGSGFGTITDLTAGPGGLYVLSLTNGSLYRITTADVGSASAVSAVPEPGSAITLAIIYACFTITRRHSGRASRKILP